MAMLEAFVYDPLISWRLLAQDNDTTTVTTAGSNAVEKAVRQSMDAPTPTVGSPAAEIVTAARSEIESESRLKSEPPNRDKLPKLLRLKSTAMESSQETLNTRSSSPRPRSDDSPPLPPPPPQSPAGHQPNPVQVEWQRLWSLGRGHHGAAAGGSAHLRGDLCGELVPSLCGLVSLLVRAAAREARRREALVEAAYRK
jgi:hypothetical protein